MHYSFHFFPFLTLCVSTQKSHFQSFEEERKVEDSDVDRRKREREQVGLEAWYSYHCFSSRGHTCLCYLLFPSPPFLFFVVKSLSEDPDEWMWDWWEWYWRLMDGCTRLSKLSRDRVLKMVLYWWSTGEIFYERKQIEVYKKVSSKFRDNLNLSYLRSLHYIL